MFNYYRGEGVRRASLLVRRLSVRLAEILFVASLLILFRLAGLSPLCHPALELLRLIIPQDEQDAIASQILASLADEDAWKKRFVEKREVIHRMAREALEEDERGETRPLDDLL